MMKLDTIEDTVNQLKFRPIVADIPVFEPEYSDIEGVSPEFVERPNL